MQAQYQQVQSLAIAWGKKIGESYLGIQPPSRTSSAPEPSILFPSAALQKALPEFTENLDIALYRSDAAYIFDEYWRVRPPFLLPPSPAQSPPAQIRPRQFTPISPSWLILAGH